MVKKVFNTPPNIHQPPVIEFPPLTKPERPPRVECPPLRSYGSDDDLDYSYVRGSPSVGGGAILVCVVLIIFGILKISGTI